ncbi:hypothetical protein ACFSQ7_27315 [Paenibacillus rhizoplanae]
MTGSICCRAAPTRIAWYTLLRVSLPGGAEAGEVREMLINSFEFDPKEAELILARALPHRMEPDGGYGAFIKEVNQLLGEKHLPLLIQS